MKKLKTYEAPPKEFQNCQSHLADKTLEQMKKDFELSHKLNTPKTINYLMKQKGKSDNEHLVHWLNTGLGRYWIEQQEGDGR